MLYNFRFIFRTDRLLYIFMSNLHLVKSVLILTLGRQLVSVVAVLLKFVVYVITSDRVSTGLSEAITDRN